MPHAHDFECIVSLRIVFSVCKNTKTPTSSPPRFESASWSESRHCILLPCEAVIVGSSRMPVLSSSHVWSTFIGSRTNFVKHSKYNPKYDPKHSSYQPRATAPVDQIPVVTPVASIPSAQAAASPQAETRNSDAVIANPNREAAQSDSQDAPVAMQTSAAITDRDMDTSISDSRQPATGQNAHAVREPSALTGGLPELPAAQTDSETGEKTPGLSTKPIS